MDFHAFKRSKALQSPVCLLGWNSEGTAVSVARGAQSSGAVTGLSCAQIHTCRCSDHRQLRTLS